MTNHVKLTAKSLALFISLAKDAQNWNGMPMFDGTRAERGNLTHLKKLGLLTTDFDEDIAWVTFTEAGKELAAEHGVKI